jgi:negative regulator of genetic competence, sporulation and motility
MKSDYFVKVHEPLTHRVLLLESSKLIISALQSYHRTLFIRKQKLDKVELLKNQAKELLLLLQKVEELLPKEHMPDDGVAQVRVKPTESKLTRQVSKQEHGMDNKLFKLNKTLEDIEKRLKSME